MKATEVTKFISPNSLAISVFVSTFQSLIMFCEPLARIVPVLLKQRQLTLNSNRLAISVFVSIFQSLIVLSYDPLAKIVPVLLKATELTESLCPNRL